MKAITEKDTIKTITTHYIDGAFVESHGREVMDIINPSNSQVIARVTLADEEDARRAIAAARRAFASFGRTTKEERAKVLRRLHEVVSARIDDLTAAMVDEYGGTVVFSKLIIEAAANTFLSAEKALNELPLTQSRGKTTVTLEPVGVAGLITPWNANSRSWPRIRHVWDRSISRTPGDTRILGRAVIASTSLWLLNSRVCRLSRCQTRGSAVNAYKKQFANFRSDGSNRYDGHERSGQAEALKA